MNAEQREARDSFAALLRHPAEADAHYDLLMDSHGGRIISTDIARFLETRYRDTPAGRPRDLAPGWDLAWRYAQDRLRREITVRNGRHVVRFMAGGWGAGKTHALQGAELADIAWDGTLEGYRWARDMIDLALGHGWRVQIAYVLRDIDSRSTARSSVQKKKVVACRWGNFRGTIAPCSVPFFDCSDAMKTIRVSYSCCFTIWAPKTFMGNLSSSE